MCGCVLCALVGGVVNNDWVLLLEAFNPLGTNFNFVEAVFLIRTINYSSQNPSIISRKIAMGVLFFPPVLLIALAALVKKKRLLVAIMVK